MSSELPLENETQQLAWALLRAANRVQAKGTTIRIVVPRASEVLYDLNIEQISQRLIVAAEEWLEEQGYLAPANVGLTWSTYTIPLQGRSGFEEGCPSP